MGDRITDLLFVLAEIQRERHKDAVSAQGLRIDAVEAVAERETARGRFKNLQSARNTINDALARRFGGRSLPEFDVLLDEYLRGKPKRLKAAALTACWRDDQREFVQRLFQ